MSQVYVWDFTICESGEGKPTIRLDLVKKLCNDLGKKFTFQLEDTGSNRHYQGRISLKEKVRENTCVTKFKRYLPEDAYFKVSVTSNENKKNNFYVTKEDSRIDGPWSDTDEKEVYVPRQLRMLFEDPNWTWRPFQQDILATFDVFNVRHINVLVDTKGCIGKTILKTTAGVFGRAMTIPMINDYKDIMRMVMDMPKKGGYIIDMPRAIKKEKLFQMYSAIEQVKDGYAFDDRYKFQWEYFDSPVIWVFCNTVPDKTLLSNDRWRIWEVNSKWELVPYNEPVLTEMPWEGQIIVDTGAKQK